MNKKKFSIVFCIITVICLIIASLLILIKFKDDRKGNNKIINAENYIVDANNKKDVAKTESKLTKANEYNTFTIQAVTEEALINKFLEDYKYNTIYHIEDAYNSLDKSYKENRFSDIGKYKEFLSKRQETITKSQLSKYQIIKQDNYDQYICLDQYNNYYIFNKFSDMSYTVLLDTYTIDLPQFTEKYNSASNENKVAMNAEKIRNAINSQDYNYVYNKLDETFKQNKYPSLERFEEYIINTLFKYNQFNYKEASKEGEVYALTFTVEDIEKNTEKQIEGTIIMQLKEGTDFVMSFNFE